MSKSLEFEAMEALRGAHEVRDNFLKVLNIGIPSISDLAYAIRSRVKDDFKLVEKVKKKRSEEKPDYRMTDVRDVVGVRIVTLYRLDALSLIPVLLDRIEEDSGPEESNFFLSNPIEEVKIFSVNPSGDAQRLPTRLKSLFVDRGYGEKCFVEQKPENYSSTHIVVWTRGRWSNKLREIPVEIQVRTALEDVWGEMDHKLKYKRDKSLKFNAESLASIENCLAHLNVMKTLNDGLAQYGDQVKIQMDDIEESVRRSSRTRLAEEPAARLMESENFSGNRRDSILYVLGVAREVLDIRRIDLSGQSLKIPKIREALRIILEALSNEALRCDSDDFFNRELRYVLLMERALLEFELGRCLGKVAGNEHLLRSEEIYIGLEEEFPLRVIIPYRLSRVRYELSQNDQAIAKIRHVCENFESLDSQEGQWIKASAHRILGFWNWDSARKKSSELEPEEAEEVLRQACLEAVGNSLKARAIEVIEASSPNEYPHESARLMATSNCVFFVVEYIENGGKWNVLEEMELGLELFNQFVAEVRQFDESVPADFHKLNTLRRAYLLLQNPEQALHFAELAIRNLEMAGFHDRGGNSEEEYVLRECRKTIRSPTDVGKA